jgi:class 3 adenylate cyclase
MQAAQGRVLCDDELFQEAVSAYTFEALAPIRVKGKDRAVRVYRPIPRQRVSRADRVGAPSAETGQAWQSDAGRGTGPQQGAAGGGSILDGLSPGARLVLKVASVVGNTFGRDVLQAVLPAEMDRPRLAADLLELEDAGLIVTSSRGDGSEYRFASVATWQSVYDTLLFSQRRQLHRAVAEWHEDRYAGDLRPFHSVLARHWLGADDVAKAIVCLERAAEEATRQGDLRQAERYLEESLELSTRQSVLSREFYGEGTGVESVDAS